MVWNQEITFHFLLFCLADSEVLLLEGKPGVLIRDFRNLMFHTVEYVVCSNTSLCLMFYNFIKGLISSI